MAQPGEGTPQVPGACWLLNDVHQSLDSTQKRFGRLNSSRGIFPRHMACLTIVADTPQLEQPVQVSAEPLIKSTRFDKPLMDRGDSSRMPPEFQPFGKEYSGGGIERRVVCPGSDEVEMPLGQ